LKDATLDYRASAEVTQQQLKEIGIETELEEIPQAKNMESKWAISKDD
jgi:ABC-type transport system substrate-binding protein